MGTYKAGPRVDNLDSLIDVKDFSTVPGGIPVTFRRDKTGLPFTPAPVTESLNLAPSGGLEYNALDQLTINLNEPSDLNLSENGLKFNNPMTRDLAMGGYKINGLLNTYPPTDGTQAASWGQAVMLVTDGLNIKVNKAGDTMTGNLLMSNNLVKGLSTPIDDNDAVHKIYVVDAINTRVTKTGDTMTGNLTMGGNYIRSLATPVNNNDAANKLYVDGLAKPRLNLIPRIGQTTQDHQTIDFDITGPHVPIGYLFKFCTGTNASNWNTATGLYTVPSDGAGIYFVVGNFRVRSPLGVGTLANMYTSINGNTTYGTATNIVYRVYSRTNNLDTWHSFEIAGYIILNAGDTVGINCSYATGTWEFHTTGSLQMARFGI